MNDITNLPTDTRTIPLTAGGAVRGIIPQSVEEAYRMAQLVMKSGLAPKHLKTPEAVLATILQGAEIGLPPMFSLSKIAVINDRPTIWGDAVPALIRASGQCEYIKETIVGEGDDMKAVCVTKRRGEPEAMEGEFSVSDARAAGLWGKNGPWKHYPKRMLKMRARALLRDVYADILGGLYLREEMEDMEPVSVVDIPSPPSETVEEIALMEEPAQEAPEPDTSRFDEILDDFERQVEGQTEEGISELCSEYRPLLEEASEAHWERYNDILGTLT